jgi:hypothetical protein
MALPAALWLMKSLNVAQLFEPERALFRDIRCERYLVAARIKVAVIGRFNLITFTRP